MYRDANGRIIKGAVLPDFIRQKMRISHLGVKRPQTGFKISLALKGREISPEHRRKLSIANTGKKHSAESKRKMSLARIGKRRGEKSNLWKGGVTPLNALIRTSSEYKRWRISVFERDGYKCQYCGDRSRKGHAVLLEADHIKPFAYFPELRFEISNGRTLCVPCHRTTPTYGVKISQNYETGRLKEKQKREYSQMKAKL